MRPARARSEQSRVESRSGLQRVLAYTNAVGAALLAWMTKVRNGYTIAAVLDTRTADVELA
eukprot:2125693-Pleurochrysis_carterae.AAC.1